MNFWSFVLVGSVFASRWIEPPLIADRCCGSPSPIVSGGCDLRMNQCLLNNVAVVLGFYFSACCTVPPVWLPALRVLSSWRNVGRWTFIFGRRIGRCDRKEKVSAFPRPPCSAGEIPFHSAATFTPLTPSITDQCIYTPNDSFFFLLA